MPFQGKLTENEMSALIFAIFAVVVLSMAAVLWATAIRVQSTSDYTVGDTVYCKATGTEMWIIRQPGWAAVAYTARYSDDLGEVHTIVVYADEITKAPTTIRIEGE